MPGANQETATTQTYRIDDLVYEVTKKTGADRNATKATIKATLEVVREMLASGGKLQLQDFGTFQTTKRSERSGVNPQTREKMTIPARTGVHFKPSSGWKGILGGGSDAPEPSTPSYAADRAAATTPTKPAGRGLKGRVVPEPT